MNLAGKSITGSSDRKLMLSTFRIKIRDTFLAARVINHWNNLVKDMGGLSALGILR